MKESEKRQIKSLLPEKYEYIKFLASGGFGQVVQCEIKSSLQEVAIKIPLRRDGTRQEIALLRRLMAERKDEKNFVKFFEAFDTPVGQAMVFEMLSMTIWTFVKTHHPMPLLDISSVVKQVATALAVLKDWSIIHADIKPGNVMVVDHTYRPLHVKVIDFGMALPTSRALQGLSIQNICHKPPEIILGLPWNESVDVWCLGTTFAYMLLKDNLFPNLREFETLKVMVKFFGQPHDYLLEKGRTTFQYFHYSNGRYSLWNDYSCFDTNRFDSLEHLFTKAFLDRHEPSGDIEAAKDLFQAMMTMSNDERITPNEILQHPFITSWVNPLSDISGDSCENIMQEDIPLSQDEFQKILPDGYRVTKMLGSGTFGQLVQCKQPHTWNRVTIKLPHSSNRTLREVRLLKKIVAVEMDCHNIVKFIDTLETSCGKLLVLERFNMSLAEYIEQRRPLPLMLMRVIVQQTANALRALELRGLIHTGVSARNIWFINQVWERPQIKLSDFGAVVRRKKAECGMEVQHVSYRAPEILLGLPFDQAIDVWSFGCMLVHMLIGIELFPSQTAYDTLRILVKLFGQPPNEVLEEALKTQEYFCRVGGNWKLKTIEEFEEIARLSPGVIQTYEAEQYNSVDALIESHVSMRPNDIEMTGHLVECIDLVKGMLNIDATLRIPAAQILKHPFTCGRIRKSAQEKSRQQTPLKTPLVKVETVEKPSVDNRQISGREVHQTEDTSAPVTDATNKSKSIKERLLKVLRMDKQSGSKGSEIRKTAPTEKTDPVPKSPVSVSSHNTVKIMWKKQTAKVHPTTSCDKSMEPPVLPRGPNTSCHTPSLGDTSSKKKSFLQRTHCVSSHTTVSQEDKPHQHWSKLKIMWKKRTAKVQPTSSCDKSMEPPVLPRGQNTSSHTPSSGDASPKKKSFFQRTQSWFKQFSCI